MLLGHFAVAFAAKKLDARPSLGTYFAAAQLPDLLWPVFLLTGLERVTIAPGDTAFTPLYFEHYPISHSLLTIALWGALLGILLFKRTRNRAGATAVCALALSHWVLDFITHRPDLPLLPWSSRVVGLGLWRSVPATFLIEGTLFVIGLAVYLRSTHPRDGIGRYGLMGLVAFLVIAYLGNVFGSPPPNVTAIALVGLLGATLILSWAIAVDRHRDSGGVR